ncbi:hypothetical protein S245_043171 [Arachis hypogaea]
MYICSLIGYRVVVPAEKHSYASSTYVEPRLLLLHHRKTPFSKACFPAWLRRCSSVSEARESHGYKTGNLEGQREREREREVLLIRIFNGYNKTHEFLGYI